ncbi:MAG: response regulator transcription factor [candidate division Zixibacteria bacterium]|nr:response regulator transcription factor [candidate division Zixibacteria bacterium]
MPIKTVIVDDEPLALEELAYQLSAIDEIVLAGEATNGPEAIALILRTHPDLVFIDIQMPGKDGFQVAKEIAGDAGNTPHIVFVTAYNQYALRAFEVDAVDYLLKPIDENLLARAVQRVEKRMENTPDIRGQLETLFRALDPNTLTPRRANRIAVRKGARFALIDTHEILYACIAEGVVFVVTEAFEGMTGYRTLEELELDLDPQVFCRVHRGYIANIDRVSEIVPWFSGTYRLVMNDTQKREIPLSRAQSKKLRKLLRW